MEFTDCREETFTPPLLTITLSCLLHLDISVVAITAMLNYDRSDVVSVGGIAVVRGRLEPVNDTECERVAAELKHRAVMQNR